MTSQRSIPYFFGFLTLMMTLWKLGAVPVCSADPKNGEDGEVLDPSSIDWPQWRGDAGRTAVSTGSVPAREELEILWTRDFPPLEPAYRDERLQFDAGYEPVAAGNRVFLASPREDWVLALDGSTGEILWRFFAGGPVRFAPVASLKRVWFGSDDGKIYCLNAENGSLQWSFRAVPSRRKMLGNKRLISVWPVRGGPVLHGETLYFAAGVWPMEGVFVYALNAENGKVIWHNDRCGSLYGVHPHNAEAQGGLAPQGYLLVTGDELIVPSSSAYPAKFDLDSGALLEFELPAAGRKPGGWFVSTSGGEDSKLGLVDKGELQHRRSLLFEKSINRKRHEDSLREVGQEGVRRHIQAGKTRISFDDLLPGVEGEAHSIIAARGKLFAATRGGRLYCLGTPSNRVPSETQQGQVRRQRGGGLPQPRILDSSDAEALRILKATGAKYGRAIVMGCPPLARLETLAANSKLRVTAFDSSPEIVQRARQSLLDTGLYGSRIVVSREDLHHIDLPPYPADLLVIEDSPPHEKLTGIAQSVRPFGGKMVFPARGNHPAAWEAPPGFEKEEKDGLVIWTRITLPGSSNYTGGWKASPDELVQAPLGVLWFDDSLGHFKRSPQPKFVDGVMISADKYWLDASTRTTTNDYRLQPAIFSDVYTGRVLESEEALELREEFSEVDLSSIQPSQYRPPLQKDAWKPGQPSAGMRKNPLTGEEEKRVFPKSYGCDGGFDYGHVYTLRSGTAAFYDKRSESGTINVSGPRSGCTNSIIPACGLLNLPYFYEGCTCSYPLPASLSLISLPEIHEQWASWGPLPFENIDGKIQRIGINFGAPGDRMTREGTLWLDFPNVGGPSPDLGIETEPSLDDEKIKKIYRHSLRIANPNRKAWPWVAASALSGISALRIRGLKNGDYQVRLIFADLEENTGNDGEEPVEERSFDILVQNKSVRSAFKPAQAAGGRMRAVAVEAANAAVKAGEMEIEFRPLSGAPIISGVELLRRK